MKDHPQAQTHKRFTYLKLSIFVGQLSVLLEELGIFVSDELLQLDHQLFQVGQPLHGLLRYL